MILWSWLGCPKPPPTELPPSDPALAAPLPVDPGVRHGVFDNGLHWYVEPHHEPAARAVLRLVVRVGSVVEDDDQRGLAHFVEHMAFNGTTHFPGNEVITYLGSIGAQFGPHLNASTGFDETVYKLTVPTDDPEVFDRAFVVLEDWAHGLSFDPTEIENERPVVLEEWRTRLGASGRIRERTVPLTYWGSPYAERLPIGTEQSLRTFAPDAVRRFYADWYRPDQMAVIAVGDFDPDEVEAKIRDRFAPLTNPDKPRERPVFEIPDHPDTKYAIIADPEITRSGVTVLAKTDRIEKTTVGDYRDKLVEQLGFGMINERLGELARQPDAPFLGAAIGIQRLSPTEAAFALSAGTREDGTEAAYASLLTELRRVREHGFGAQELARARSRVLESYDNLLREKDKTDSADEAAELVRVFTTGESMPGVDAEVALAQQYVPQITVDELDRWAQVSMPDASRVVTVILPAKDGLAVPTEASLAAIEARVAAATIDAPPDEGDVGPLIDAPPTPGTVVATDDQYAAALGFTGWTLSNGVRVWFRDTDFKQDQVLMTAFSPGGASHVADADDVSAELAAEVLHRSGFGRLDASGLSRWLAGRRVSLGHRLSEGFEVVTGEASPEDLGVLLEEVWASTTAPRFSDDGFRTTLEQRRTALLNRIADPTTRFEDTYTGLVWRDAPRRQPWTVDTLARADLDRIRAVWADRFGEAGDFVFVFVGNLPDDFRTQVEAYLASLPTTGRTEGIVDRGERPVMGPLSAVVTSGVDPVGRVRLEWRGPLPEDTWDTRSRLFALGDVLETMLREELREALGGVYGVGVSADESWVPVQRYTVRVEFGCDPARVDELIAATDRVVATLKADGPPPDKVLQTQEQNRRAREQSLRTNPFWLSAFSGALQRGADPLQLLTWDQRNDALSPVVIRDAARAWLDDANRVRVVLVPSSTPSVAPPVTP